MEYTGFFVGSLTYLQAPTWYYEPDRERWTVAGRGGQRYLLEAFPVRLYPPVSTAARPVAHGSWVFRRNVDDTYSEEAFAYLKQCTGLELANRMRESRRETFQHRLTALAALYHYIERDPAAREQKLAEWNSVHRVQLHARNWSEGQAEVLEAIRVGLECCDANSSKMTEAPRSQYLFISGEPGSGKSGT